MAMLQCKQLSKRFIDPARGAIAAVDDLTLDLPAGIVAIVGANGAGKSTFLRLVAGLMAPRCGDVDRGGL